MLKFSLGNFIFNFKNFKKNNIFIRLKKPLFTNKYNDKKILIIGTGPSFLKEKKNIEKFIKTQDPLVIAINNIPNDFKIDFRIFTNRARFAHYSHLKQDSQKIILSPYFKNKFIFKYIKNKNIYFTYYKIDPNINSNFKINNYIISFKENPNTGFIALLSAYIMGSNKIYLAGIDGYSKKTSQNYYNETADPHSLENQIEQDKYLYLLYQDILNLFTSKKILLKSITESKYSN